MAPKLSTKLETNARKQPSNMGMMPSILRPRRRILCADYNKVDTDKFIMSPTIDEISLPQPWSNVVVSPNTNSLTPSDMARNAYQLIGKVNWEDEELRQARKGLLMPADALFKPEDKEDCGQDGGEEGSETNSLKVSNWMMTDGSKDISAGQPERSSTYAETAEAIRISKTIAQDVLQSKATETKMAPPREVSKNVVADDKTSVRQPSSAPSKKGAAEDGGKASSFAAAARSANSTVPAEPDTKATKLSREKARGQDARTKTQSAAKEATTRRSRRRREEESKKAKNSPRTIGQLKKEETIKVKEFEKLSRELTRKANREVIEWKQKESEDSETVKRRNLAELMFSEKKMKKPRRGLFRNKERAKSGRARSTVGEREQDVTARRNRYRLGGEHYRLDEQAAQVLAQNLPSGRNSSRPPFKHIFVFNPQLSVVENLSKYAAPAIGAGYTRKMLTRRMISDIRRTNMHVAEKFLKQ